MKNEEMQGGAEHQNGRMPETDSGLLEAEKSGRCASMQHSLFKGVSRVWVGGKETVGEVFDSGERLIQRNPAASVLACCVGGGAIGLVCGWLLAKEERETRTFAYRFLRRLGDRLSVEHWHA